MATKFLVNKLGGIYMKNEIKTGEKLKRYEAMVDDFCQRYPMWGQEIDDWFIRHAQCVRIILNNGEKIDYNGQSHTCRFIDQNDTYSPRDITDDDCRSAFDANLREHMCMRGIGRVALADKAGISQAMISKYLLKKSTPTITSLRKIACALECEPEDLLK